jgi:hypothetical protein
MRVIVNSKTNGPPSGNGYWRRIELGRRSCDHGQHRMQTKPVLRGWKLHVEVGVISYVFLVPLMWLSSLKRHPNSPFETVPELGVFAAIASVCIVVSVAWTERKKR